jgi:excisionase family DNA binding protein
MCAKARAGPTTEDHRVHAGRGMTPREVAKYLRVSPDRVRAWIKKNVLAAVNTASTRCGRPRWVVLPHHLAEWEQGRRANPPPKPLPRRRQPADFVDYYPD